MTYSIRFSKQTQRQIAHLPGHVRSLTKRRILDLRTQPRPSDAKELDGHPSFYRIWLDVDYRLVWQVDDEIALMDILYVGPKSDGLYAKFGLGRS